MKCPACTNTLSEVEAGDVFVDICQGGCAGVWFDFKELKKFDEPHEFEAAVILDAKRGAAPNFKNNVVRYCPVCVEKHGEDAFMARRFYSIKEKVEIDQCLKCSGIWLDPGELKAIRSEYATEKERYRAADKFLDGALNQATANVVEATRARLEEYQKNHSNRRAYLAYLTKETENDFEEGLENFKIAFGELLAK